MEVLVVKTKLGSCGLLSSRCLLIAFLMDVVMGKGKYMKKKKEKFLRLVSPDSTQPHNNSLLNTYSVLGTRSSADM